MRGGRRPRVLQRGDFWMAFFLDDANEAEAVGTDVGSKAVAEGERETMWRNA